MKLETTIIYFAKMTVYFEYIAVQTENFDMSSVSTNTLCATNRTRPVGLFHIALALYLGQNELLTCSTPPPLSLFAQRPCWQPSPNLRPPSRPKGAASIPHRVLFLSSGPKPVSPLQQTSISNFGCMVTRPTSPHTCLYFGFKTQLTVIASF